MKNIPIELSVNGQQVSATVETRTSLVDFLRDTLRLTGTHVGCEHGICGACTVLLNGEPVRSCCMFAVQANGLEITTVEGLAPERGQLSKTSSKILCLRALGILIAKVGAPEIRSLSFLTYSS